MSSKPSKLWYFVMLLSACNSGTLTVSVPAFPDGGFLRNSTPVSAQSLLILEGMFNLTQGSDLFGPDAAVRSAPSRISILSGQEGGYAVLNAGCIQNGTELYLEGYWRYPGKNPTGLIRLQVQPQSAAQALCAGQTTSVTPSTLVLSGGYGNDDIVPKTPLQLTYQQALKPFRGVFFTIGHHGACADLDRCGASINSLETIPLSESVGANAIELDVRMTRDNIPILYHDAKFTSAGARGRFCQGAVEDLTYAEILANCSLIYGEHVPTLEEALATVIEQTTLEAVYVDMKVSNAVAPAIPIVKKANDDAVAAGRQMRALIALTSSDVTDAWNAAAPPAGEPPCLLEYDPNLAIQTGCRAWGPTWTAGPQADNVNMVHAAGLRVVFWTLNSQRFIDTYLTDTTPDGIISDRAGLVFYRYQKIGTVPAPLPTPATSSTGSAP